MRPDDVTTIQLVLDAIHINETIFYGVIINKLEESIMRKLNISAARDIVTSSLSTIGKTVMFPLMVPHIPQLFGAENEVNEGLGVLVRDFVDMLPPNKIKREVCTGVMMCLLVGVVYMVLCVCACAFACLVIFAFNICVGLL